MALDVVSLRVVSLLDQYGGLLAHWLDYSGLFYTSDYFSGSFCNKFLISSIKFIPSHSTVMAKFLMCEKKL